MNIRFTVGLILAVASAFVGSQNSDAATTPKAILGYYQSDDSSYNSLVTYNSAISQLSTDSFSVTATGSVVGDAPTTAITLAKGKHIPVYACVSNFNATDFDPALAHAVISNPTIVNKLVTNIVSVVRKNHYAGVNIDFESINNTDRANYSSFVHKVAVAMRAAKYVTVVSVPAKLSDDPNDSWAGAFDFQSLGQDADIIQLMTYDENGPWSAPGPVAGFDWVEKSVRYAVSVIPSSKVNMGLAAYGYDWNRTDGTGVQVPWQEIPGLISQYKASLKRSTVTASPYFSYVAQNGSRHVVWYEDTVSIEKKTNLAVKYNLAGVSVWAMGMEDASFWHAVYRGLMTSSTSGL